MFSVICADGGTAATSPLYHGFSTFDFDQTNHPAFDLVGVGLPGAPSGCCVALTMAWLHNWQANGLVAYSTWVNLGGGGHAGVLAHTVAVFAPPGPWNAVVGALMGGLGFAPVAGLAPAGLMALAAAGRGPALGAAVLGARYTILVATGPAGSHAMGVLRSGNAVHFFDSNHGEIHFASAADFGNWFFNGGYIAACITPVVGGAATYSIMQFN